jgi:formylglycine-generating enzyme required for sulfatase activity
MNFNIFQTEIKWIVMLLLSLTLQSFSLNAQTIPSPLANGKRIAMVVGNSQYQHLTKLHTPDADARLIQSQLQKLGFQVEFVKDTNREQLQTAIERFIERSTGADAAVFYYSGHGVSLQGSTRLLPVEAITTSDTSLRNRSVDISAFAKDLQNAKPRVGLILLDACRDVPVGKSTVSKGLGRLNATRLSLEHQVMVSFATQAGDISNDGVSGGVSPYAKALANELSNAHRLPIRTLFDNVKVSVYKDTNENQLPEQVGDLRADTYLLRLDQIDLSIPSQLSKLRASETAANAEVTNARVSVKDCSDCPAMVSIQGGVFLMGSPQSEDGRTVDESPQRSVSIKSFMLSLTEVTQGQWKSLMGNNPSYYKECGDDCPVEGVSWDDTQEFIKRLNAKTKIVNLGRQYRLPSEAEWEYAARGGTTTPYWWGAKANHEYANYGVDECCYGIAIGSDRWVDTAPVAQFPPNAYGLHDMHGNVWEWVQDIWHDNYIGAPLDGTAWVVQGKTDSRVVRGGAFHNNPTFLRSAKRIKSSPRVGASSIGFRLAMSY